jgi:single-strand DNA-binding protein
MTETVIHVVGHIGTDIAHRELPDGTHKSTFRLAATPRHYDRAQRGWVDGPTNWLSVQCWRSLALNVARSLHRGDQVVVVGKLRTQEWEKDGVRSSRFILEAIAVGHDLARGVSIFTKMTPQRDCYPDVGRPDLQSAQETEARAGGGSLAAAAENTGRHELAARRLADAS